MQHLSFRALCASLLCSFLLGCGCPPDEKIGEIRLQSSTQGWIAYQGNETLPFTNANRDGLRLRNRCGAEASTDRLCIRTICTENKIKGQSFCEYFDAESRRFIFQDDADSLLLDLLFYSAVYDPEARHFVDVVRVTLSWGTAIISGEKVLGQNFSGILDSTKLSLGPPLEELGRVKLDSVYFENVYSRTEGPLALWLSPEQGLVGFSRNGELYRLGEAN
ncbi:MAG: hypothetical protein AAF998_03835 [Bacteroidota bacterium]